MSLRQILSISLLAFSFHQAFSQRHIKGQLALTPYVGIVDKFPGKPLNGDGQGYVGGIDLVRYTKTETYWKVAYQYDRKFYQFFDDRLMTERHLLSFDWAPVTFHDLRRNYYIMPLIGANVGVETVNRNNLELAQGTILNRSTGTMGLQTGLESEVYFLERTALFLSVSERWLPYSDVGNFRTYGTIGVRFSFFKH